jgi:hypothetical protein
VKLLLRAYDKHGKLVGEHTTTREFQVAQAGDGIYNVPITHTARTVSISVISVDDEPFDPDVAHKVRAGE